jgi:hypothetical protein
MISFEDLPAGGGGTGDGGTRGSSGRGNGSAPGLNFMTLCASFVQPPALLSMMVSPYGQFSNVSMKDMKIQWKGMICPANDYIKLDVSMNNAT